MKRKTEFIIILFLLLPIYTNCQTYKYYKPNTFSGKEFLLINSNNTYEYTWYRLYDVGPIEDTINHKGKIKKGGDTLVLESYTKPNKYRLLSVKEKNKKNNDSLLIIINTKDKIPLPFISPNQIRINDIYYPIKKPLGNYINFAIKKIPVKYIILAGYPIYYVKDTFSDYFEFTIKELNDIKDEYPANTYFIDEKFLIKGDSLFHLRNNEINRNDVFIKE